MVAPWVDIATRLGVAVLYAWGAWNIAFRLPTNGDRISRRFLGYAMIAWACWYVVLAFGDLQPDPWGVFNRGLHLPLVLALVNFSDVWRHHLNGNGGR